MRGRPSGLIAEGERFETERRSKEGLKTYANWNEGSQTPDLGSRELRETDTKKIKTGEARASNRGRGASGR